MLTTKHTISLSGSGSAVFHRDLLPRLELCIVFVRVFLLRAHARAAHAINLHDIGLTAIRTTSM